MYSSPRLIISVLCLASFDTACRGRLPPTEPPRVSDDGVPSTSTNDGPTLGKLTGEGIPLPAGKGGSSVLPDLPGPGPAGSAGTGGSSAAGGGAGGGAIR
jgi:hypothetical protein